MKVMTVTGRRRNHILEDARTLCGVPFRKSPFGLNSGVELGIGMINCKRCLKIWAKKQGESIQ